jgi:hypothetical protein
MSDGCHERGAASRRYRGTAVSQGQRLEGARKHENRQLQRKRTPCPS